MKGAQGEIVVGWRTIIMAQNHFDLDPDLRV